MKTFTVLILCATILISNLAIKDLQKNQLQLLERQNIISANQTMIVEILDIMTTNSCDLPQE